MACKRLIPSLLIIFFFLTSFSVYPNSYASNDEISWLNDFNTALNEAEQNNRIMVVAFYTAWCVYCKKMDRDVFTDERIVDLSEEFIFTKLDADLQKAATIKYRPEGYPTYIFSSPNGEEILRLSGYRDADQFLAVLEAVHDHGGEFSDLLIKIDKNPKDCLAYESLGKLYLHIGLFEKAEHYLNKALKTLPTSACITDEATESEEERILFTLSQTYLADKNFRKASKTLEKLIDKNLSCDCIRTYWLELGRVFKEWGKDNKALKILEKVIEIYPDSEEAQVAKDIIQRNHS